MMNTRSRKEGPDGITLFNCIERRIKDQESTIALCNLLIEMKLDSMDAMDDIIDRW